MTKAGYDVPQEIAPASASAPGRPGGGGRLPEVGPERMLRYELIVQLPHGVGFIRPAVPDGPAPVRLVLVDHEVRPFLIDAEGPGLPIVFPDKETHLFQGHAPGGAVGLQLGYGPGLAPGPGRGGGDAGEIIGVRRAALRAILRIGAHGRSAVFAANRRHSDPS